MLERIKANGRTTEKRIVTRLQKVYGLPMDWTVAAFYKFVPLRQMAKIQPELLAALKAKGACGSVLLAEEGVNGTIAAPPSAIRAALSAIEQLTNAGKIETKFATVNAKPFRRMKVRLKKEIVTIGPVAANPNDLVGTYVAPLDWNQLIAASDVTVIDTRNTYEFGVGTFKGAIDPATDRFSEFPAWVRRNLKDKKARIAMFCTGGIRCEKASSFLKHEGFENVFHLKGGILKYLEEVPADKSLWQGGCFVFDERVAVGPGLKVLDYSICHGCLAPVSAEGRRHPKYEEGVCCPACADSLSEAQKSSNRERQRQVDLAARRGLKHLGPL
jgi:UPF0176 protein